MHLKTHCCNSASLVVMEDQLYSELIKYLSKKDGGRLPGRLSGKKNKNERKKWKRLASKCKVVQGRLFHASKVRSGALMEGRELTFKKTVWKEVVKASKVATVLQKYHDTGHLGIDQTVRKINDLYYMKNALDHVRQYIRRCPVCQVQKSSVVYSKQRHILAKAPMERLMLDHTVNYPECPLTGHRYCTFPRSSSDLVLLTIPFPRHLLLAIDCYSKYAFGTTCATLGSQEYTEFLEGLFAEHGEWAIVHTDNGSAFTSAEAKELYKNLGTEEVHRHPYHPRKYLYLSLSTHTHRNRCELVSVCSHTRD